MPTLPRVMPAYETMKVGGELLPTALVLSLRQDRQDLYDLRDQVLNLFVDDEVPNGPMNGSNKNFTLSQNPQPPLSLSLYRNGQFLVQGVDYNLIGRSIALAVAPVSTDTLIAFYRERLSVANAPVSTAIPPNPPSGGGGGSTGGLWTQNANFLYPTSTFTECVLVGAQTSDFFGGPGQLGTTGTIGMMTAVVNASLVYMFINPGVETQLVSNKSGTGTLLPLSFYCNGKQGSLTTGGLWFFSHNISTTDLSLSAGSVITDVSFFVITAATNASFFQFDIFGGLCEIRSSHSGAGGVDLPMVFKIEDLEAIRITTARVILAGLTSTDLTGLGPGDLVASAAFIVASASTNASIFDLTIFGGLCEILSTHTGTGTTLPIAFLFGATEAARFKTDGSLLIGLTSTDFGTTAGMVVVTSTYALVSATTNASTFQLHMGTGVSCQIISSSTGTGTLLPIAFLLASTEIARFTSSGGNLLVGATSSDQIGSGSFVGAGQNIFATDSMGVISASANASTLYFSSTPSVMAIVSDKTGTGTLRPLTFNMSATEIARFTTVGILYVGATTSDVGWSNSSIVSNGGQVGVMSATVNAVDIFLNITAGTSVSLNSGASGTATQLPLAFKIFGTELGRFDTGGSLFLGLTSSDVGSISGRLIASNRLYVVTAATNASTLFMAITAGTECLLSANITGTGTLLTLSFYAGQVRRQAITTGGAIVFTGGSTAASYGDLVGRLLTTGDIIISTGVSANESFGRFQIVSSTVNLQSGTIGTGTLLPMTFNVNGEAMRINTSNRLLVGHTNDDGTGAVIQASAAGISVNGVLLNVP